MISVDQRQFLENSGSIARPSMSSSAVRPLVIAVVNNMPDAAIRIAEAQICKLLAGASDGITVDVRFYSLPGVPRGQKAQAHISCCYEDFVHLTRNRPDGLFVTGTEPTTARLIDEPFWPRLADLIDWSEQEGVPAIWSCLAAHAAVLQLDGIERRRMAQKLSGVFTCKVNAGNHQIMHRMPKKWCVPHSRWNGLRREDLEAQGYTILSSSKVVGIDTFMKQAPALQVFMQGHLEYDAATLLSEYRRDVLRAAAAERPVVPELPVDTIDKNLLGDIQREVQAIVMKRRLDMMPRLDLLLRSAKRTSDWHVPAQTLFGNWLSYLDVKSMRSEEAIQPPAVGRLIPARLEDAWQIV
jgi:homoserine O-succinyltransferase